MFETSNEFRPKPSLVRKFMCTAWQSKGKSKKILWLITRIFPRHPQTGAPHETERNCSVVRRWITCCKNLCVKYVKDYQQVIMNCGSHIEINICRSLKINLATAEKQASVLDFSINKLTFSVCGWHLSRSIKSTDGGENILWNIEIVYKKDDKINKDIQHIMDNPVKSEVTIEKNSWW